MPKRLCPHGLVVIRASPLSHLARLPRGPGRDWSLDPPQRRWSSLGGQLVFIPGGWEARARERQPACRMGPLPSVLPLVKAGADPRMREGEGIPPPATGLLRAAVPGEPRRLETITHTSLGSRSWSPSVPGRSGDISDLR